MTVRGLALRIGAWFGALVCGLVLSCAPAVAASDYGFTGSFGSYGGGEGQFAEPSGVAVSQASEDVYVVDKGNDRVEYFGSAGAYIGEFNGILIDGALAGKAAPNALHEPEGIAVDNDLASPSYGDVYVVDASQGVVDKFSASGEYLSQLKGFASGPIGVAVDPSGDVWVAEETSGVQEFNDAAENTLSASLTPAFGRAPGIAVDSEENLYLLRGTRNVVKFNKQGETLNEELTDCGCITGLAVDLATDDLFVDQGGSSIVEYGPYGEPYGQSVEQFGSAFLAAGGGVAVNSATGTLYVAESANPDSANNQYVDNVDMFATGLGELPLLEVESVPAVSLYSATFEAKVNPESEHQATSVTFEYSTEESVVLEGKGMRVSAGAHPVGVGGQPVSVQLGNVLTPSTTYYYRAVAENAASEKQHKPADGLIQSFSTLIAPVLTTAQAQEVTSDSATLSGTIDPRGGQTTEYHFAYMLQTAYEEALGYGGAFSEIDPAFNPYVGGASTPEVTVPAEQAVLQTRPVTITGLPPGVVYHYALVATNTQETQENGEKGTVTTTVISPGSTFELLGGGMPPVLGPAEASNITQTAVAITGSLNAQGLPTRYELRLGSEQGALQYGASGQTSATGAEPITLEVGSLAPGTLYYYQLIATSQDGTVQTAEASFTTLPAPSVQTLPLASFPQTPPLASLLPANAFGPEEPGTITTTKKAAKCTKGKKRSHGKCVKEKAKHKRKTRKVRKG